MNKGIHTILSILVATGLVIGAGMAFSGGGVASGDVDAQTFAGTTELNASSTSGQVDSITVGAIGEATWNDLPGEANRVTVELSTNSGPNESYETFAREVYWDAPSATDGSYEFERVSGDVLNETSFDADTFSAAEDGETTERYFPVKVTVTVTTDDGHYTHTEVHRVTTEVTNLEDPQVGADTEIGGEIGMA